MKFNLFGKTFYFLENDLQREKALIMLEKYIFKPEVLLILFVVAVYLIVRIIATLRKEKSLLVKTKLISPWIYFLIIVGITVFNRTPGLREIRVAFDPWFTERGFHESAVIGFLFNLCLYIPFGYLLKKYGETVQACFIVFASSFIIEALQYILARGVTAIDDLVANTLGGIIGILLAVIVQKIISKKQRLE